jgi:cyclic beta-1,2-glucan synthetase
VEGLSRGSGRSPVEVAQAAIDFCAADGAGREDGMGRARHVGWALVGPGRPRFQSAIGFGPNAIDVIVPQTPRFRIHTYIWLSVCMSVTVLAAVLAGLLDGGSVGTYCVAAVLLAPLAVYAGSYLVESTIRMFVRRRPPLPRLDFDRGIPDEFRTCIVYPVIVHDQHDIDDSLQTMSANFRSSGGIPQFLLVDLPDSAQQWTRDDAPVVERLSAEVASLGDECGATFRALFRERRWNERDRIWMGWERKRGKLEEFNRLVADDPADNSFVVDDETRTLLRSFRFVITIDAGGRLARGSAAKLAATLAHPLNQPRLGEDGTTVVAGYGVLVPGGGHAFSGSYSLFTVAAFGRPRIDYALAHEYDAPHQPMWHQDVFDEFIYTGKGIYDVRAFTAALHGKIRENSVLSHDKLEGMHARTGYVSDAQVIESQPLDYLQHRSRTHRWIRGDFHQLPWLLSIGSGKAGSPGPFGRWLMFGDLMRGLRAPGAVILLCLGWLGWVGSSALDVTAAVMILANISVVLSPLIRLVGGRKPGVTGGGDRLREMGRRVRGAGEAVVAQALRRFVWVDLMADEAVMSVDAVARSLWQMVRRRGVLQWVPDAHVSRQVANGSLMARWTVMKGGVLLSVAVAVAVAVVAPAHLVVAGPFVVAWCLAPVVTHVTAKPDRT